jgi:hypothetical protein
MIRLPAIFLSVFINPLHGFLQSEIVGFVFCLESFLELILLRRKSPCLVLVRQYVLGDPLAIFFPLKRLAANETIFVSNA